MPNFYDNAAQKFGAVTGDEWLALSQGLGQGRNWQEGLSAGIGGLREARRLKAATTRQTALDKAQQAQQAEQSKLNKLKMDKFEQDISAGKFIELPNGFLYDTINREYVKPDAAMTEAMRKANAAARPSTKFKTGQPVYDGEGNMFFPTSRSDRPGVQWVGADGQVHDSVKNPRRPQDTLLAKLPQSQKIMVDDLNNKAMSASETGANAQAFLNVLDRNPDIWTGAGATAISDLRSWAITFGAGDSEMINNQGDIEVLKNLTMNFVMGRIQNTKGAISEREMAAFEKSVPNLKNTTAGNRLILEAMVIAGRRKEEQAQFMNEQMQSGVGYWVAKREWDAYTEQNPVFNELLERADAAGGSVTGTEGRSQEIEDLINKYSPKPAPKSGGGGF
jgi:hypothetical protein